MASEVFLKDASVPLIRDARLRPSSRCDAVLQMKLFDRSSIFKLGGGAACVCRMENLVFVVSDLMVCTPHRSRISSLCSFGRVWENPRLFAAAG